MATADDFPSAFGKAERAAGRPCRDRARSSSPCATRTSERSSRSPPTLAGLGFRLVATAGTAGALAEAGIDVETAAKVSETAGGDPTVVDLIRRGRCDLVINTPQESGAARSDGYLIREAALAARVPCVTTVAGAAACVQAVAHADAPTSTASASRSALLRRQLLSVTGRESLGAVHAAARERGELDPGRPGPVLHARGAGSPAAAADEPLPRAPG